MNVLACDIGGTHLKIGVVRDGQVHAYAVKPANSKQGLAPLLPVLKNVWLRQLDELKLALPDCAGISMAFPSLVDVQSGKVLAEYGKFADAIHHDLRDWAKAEFNLPLAIENDARLALIGEWQFGAGRGCDNLVIITLGTGLGVCAIIEGRVLRGKHGQAGVLCGHTTVHYGGRACSCGNAGCAEAEASTAYLTGMAEARADYSASRLRLEPILDFAAVFKHAGAGDPCAVALRDHSLKVWSTLAVNLIHTFDPEMIIFAGGIMASGDVILPAIRAHVARYAHTPWGQVQVVASQLAGQAALVAGGWLLQEQFPHIQS